MTRKLLELVLFLATCWVPGEARKTHPDYVRDERTAERIAEAVLDSMYGVERVKAQLPLRASSASEDYWLVEGSIPQPHAPGGGYAVMINKHSGCIENVVEHTK